MVRGALRLMVGRLPKKRVTEPRDRLDVIHLRGGPQFPFFVAVSTERVIP